jgi:hypothetical protein
MKNILPASPALTCPVRQKSILLFAALQLLPSTLQQIGGSVVQTEKGVVALSRNGGRKKV